MVLVPANFEDKTKYATDMLDKISSDGNNLQTIHMRHSNNPFLENLRHVGYEAGGKGVYEHNAWSPGFVSNVRLLDVNQVLFSAEGEERVKTMWMKASEITPDHLTSVDALLTSDRYYSWGDGTIGAIDAHKARALNTIKKDLNYVVGFASIRYTTDRMLRHIIF